MHRFHDQIVELQRAAGVRVVKPPHAFGFLDPDLPTLKEQSQQNLMPFGMRRAYVSKEKSAKLATIDGNRLAFAAAAESLAFGQLGDFGTRSRNRQSQPFWSHQLSFGLSPAIFLQRMLLTWPLAKAFSFHGLLDPRIEPVVLVFNCMDTNPQIPIGDLSGNETELGVPTREMVEQRAREIARLAERDPDKFTEADWEQARAELTGPGASVAHDPTEIADSLSERDSMPAESGNRAPRVLPKDEALVDERLANRGVEEAAHDQMVEAAKSDQKQEG